MSTDQAPAAFPVVEWKPLVAVKCPACGPQGCYMDNLSIQTSPDGLLYSMQRRCGKCACLVFEVHPVRKPEKAWLQIEINSPPFYRTVQVRDWYENRPRPPVVAVLTNKGWWSVKGCDGPTPLHFMPEEWMELP